MDSLNIKWLYPDVLSLHGDRGNIMALEKYAGKLGIKPTIDRIDSFDDPLDLGQTDIVVLNPGEIKDIPHIVDALNRHRAKLMNFIENGGYVLVFGTTGGAFCNQVKRLDGTVYKCLGFFDVDCVERESVYGDDILFETEKDKAEIIGCQIHLLDFLPKEKFIPFGKIKYGYGNNGSDQTEGARYNNLIFTNTLGPMLVKNPWFTVDIIKDIISRKGGHTAELNSESDFGFTLSSLELIKKFIDGKQK